MENELIYEKLAPDEVYIISKEGDTIIFVRNSGGNALLRRATLRDE